MKKLMLLGVALMLQVAVVAQDFPVAWKTKFSFNPDRWFYDDDAKYILGRTDQEAEVLDGASGKGIWRLNFKNDLKVKTLERAVYNPDEGFIVFFNADEKKKPGDKVIVDFATGKELWRTTGYTGTDADNNFHFANSMTSLIFDHTAIVFDNSVKKFTGINVRNGSVKWQSQTYADVDLEKNVIINAIQGSEYAQVMLYNPDDLLKTKIFYMSIATGQITEDESRFTTAAGNYDQFSSGKVKIKKTVENTVYSLTGTMKEIGFKVKFELKATGGSTWEKAFESSAVRQIFNDAPYVKMDIQGDKLFVIAKFIHVFDVKTGNELWKAPFDNCDASAGLKAKQEFGIAGWPLVSDNVIYYVDLREDNAIKKVEANTGKVIWKSDKLKSDDRVPNLLLIDGVLVAQFGGMINTQTFIPNPNGGGGRYKNENRFDGNFEVRGYDPNTGKLIWSTAALAAKIGDKFKERISTIYPLNNKIVVASGDNLMALNPKTGDVAYKTSLVESKVGSMFEVLVADDYETLYVFCDNGVISASASTGKINYATKTGEIFWKLPGTSSYKFNQGKNMFMWVGESDFIGFDLASGTVKGKMKDNTDPQMTADGNSILVRDGEKLTRFSVNK